MTQLIPAGSTVAHRAVERLIAVLDDGEAEAPPRVFVECPEDDWRRHAVCLPVIERRRSVLAATSERALLDAVRLEIGGATRLPVSTHALSLACAAAAGNTDMGAACIATRAVLEIVLDTNSDLLLVGWNPSAFWYHQAGAPRLIRILQEIAAQLECIPAIVPGPYLVVTGRARDEVDAVCRLDHGLMPVHPAAVEISDVSCTGEGTTVESLMEAVGRLERTAGREKMRDLRVLELPSGRAVGRWSLTLIDADDGWAAAPELSDGGQNRWRLADSTGSRIIGESAVVDELDVSEKEILRVPGWVGAALRVGRPAALLVEAIAGSPARLGRPLWVPSVDAEGVRFLLGLPGPIWVDGPGVPGD